MEGVRLENSPRRSIPYGHPFGWSFATIPDDWEASTQVVENNLEGCDDDIPTKDVNDGRGVIGGTGGSGP